MPEIEKIQKNTKYIFLWKEWGVIIIGPRPDITDQEELELEREIQYSHRLPSLENVHLKVITVGWLGEEKRENQSPILSIIYLILQIRNYCGKYGESVVSLDTTGYNVLTMDTLQTKCGDTKVGGRADIQIYRTPSDQFCETIQSKV